MKFQLIMKSNFIQSFKGRGGIADVSKVAFPLVIASIGHGVNLFTDRVMLSNYNPAAMAAHQTTERMIQRMTP